MLEVERVTHKLKIN